MVRAKTEIEVADNGRETIVVTEIPYMVNKKDMIEKIGQMVEDKKIEGITYINDESSREGIRVIIRVKQGSNSNVVLNTLFKYTALQSSFAINNVALVKGRPMTMSLKDMLKTFVDFRHEVILRRTNFDLEKAKKRAHILEGLLKAIDVIDEIIRIIRASDSVDSAKAELMSTFGFSEAQATAIVEMRLRQLTGLEREKLQAEYDELEKFIAYCNEVLANESLQMEIIKNETQELKAKYADKRRTEITLSADEFNPEDFYADEDVVITISHFGYIKRTPLAEFRTQNRGGVGIKGSATKDEDFIEHVYVANMHSTLFLFTEQGLFYGIKVYEIPEGSRTSKGRAIQNLLNLSADNKVQAYLNIPTMKDEEFLASHYIVLATKKGTIKKTLLERYRNYRRNGDGVRGIIIREDDELIGAELTDGRDQLLIASRNGRCVRFNEEDARPLGRTSSGVRGINLDSDDEVVGMIKFSPEAEDVADRTVLVVSEHGFGKRTGVDEYRITARGSKGVKTMNVTDKTGKVVTIKNVTQDNDLMIINQSGLTIRMAVADIREAGRATQGVKLINIKEGDTIAAVSVVAGASEEKTAEEATETTEQNNENQ